MERSPMIRKIEKIERKFKINWSWIFLGSVYLYLVYISANAF
jgi:hypothetical protein